VSVDVRFERDAMALAALGAAELGATGLERGEDDIATIEGRD
jgi:hypothetical protein